MQLPRRAVRVLAVELLHGARRGGADTATESGLLEGLTRGFLFEVAEEAGVEVRRETLFPEDLETADEAFITSTTRELRPVTRIDDRVIGTGKPGPITIKLLKRYRERAHSLTLTPRV